MRLICGRVNAFVGSERCVYDATREPTRATSKAVSIRVLNARGAWNGLARHMLNSGHDYKETQMSNQNQNPNQGGQQNPQPGQQNQQPGQGGQQGGQQQKPGQQNQQPGQGGQQNQGDKR